MCSRFDDHVDLFSVTCFRTGRNEEYDVERSILETFKVSSRDKCYGHSFYLDFWFTWNIYQSSLLTIEVVLNIFLFKVHRIVYECTLL